MSDREKTRAADQPPTTDDETVPVDRGADAETAETPRITDVDPDVEADADAGADIEADPDEEPVRTRSRRARRAADSRRTGRALLTLVVLVLLTGTLLVPQVRTILRQSFTHLPETATALAFTSSPTISGTTLSVPITVTGTNTGTDTYQVKVWTVNAAGKTDGGTTAQVPMVKGVNAAVVKLPIAVDAAVVWVSLNGTDHVIHYKISVG